MRKIHSYKPWLTSKEIRYVESLYHMYGNDIFRIARSILKEEHSSEQIIKKIVTTLLKEKFFRYFYEEETRYYLYKMAYLYSFLLLEKSQDNGTKAKREEKNQYITYFDDIQKEAVASLFYELPKDVAEIMELYYIEQIPISHIAMFLHKEELEIERTLQKGIKDVKEIFWLDEEVLKQRYIEYRKRRKQEITIEKIAKKKAKKKAIEEEVIKKGKKD